MSKNIIVYEYKHFDIEDTCEAFVEKGFEIKKIGGQLKDIRNDKEFETRLTSLIEEVKPEFIFSFNYYPIISKIANIFNVTYVSWVYDSPLISLYSFTVINPCNRIFIFDYQIYEELKSSGINTVFYLPLAANAKRLNKLIASKDRNEFECDISFVGSLYNEKKHSLYDRLYNGLDDYMKGYLDGILKIQYDMYGMYILQNAIDKEDVISRLQKSIDVQTNPDGVESPAYSYADYFMARKVTELERNAVLNILPRDYKINLYTHNKECTFAGITNKGPIDYYDDMPFVFNKSKINLNITLKSIKTGIPLRVFDIMGSKGFVLSNYQMELSEYFEPGTDYVAYNSINEIPALVKYYLENEDERRAIAENAFKKVLENHSFVNRVDSILEML